MGLSKLAKKEISRKDLEAILSAEVHNSVGWIGGELQEEREDLINLYNGYPDAGGLPVIEDRSQVVTRDVLETIEWTLPSLMRLFTAGDTVVKFEPNGPEDEDEADNKTEYVNYVWRRDTPAFMLFYNWFKDSLWLKNGFIKTYWDDTDKVRREHFSGLTIDQVQEVMQGGPGDDVEVISQDEYDVDPEDQQSELQTLQNTLGIQEMDAQTYQQLLGIADPKRYDIEIKRTTKSGRVRSENVPPDEFIISRRARQDGYARLKAHRAKKTITELIEMGFDEEQLAEIAPSSSSSGRGEWNPERQARYRQTQEFPELGDGGSIVDDSMREVWIVEAYLYADYDGDGKAELRQIFAAGDSTYHILKWSKDSPEYAKSDDGFANVEVDEDPFDWLTPIPLPHLFYGLGIADLVKDLQVIRTTLWRQLLDNLYNVNNARTAAWEENVEIDDLINKRVGGVVRTDRNPAEVLMEMRTEPVIQHIGPMLEQMREEHHRRTGIGSIQQGMPDDALTDTAKGITSLLAQANERVEMIARIFAETGVKRFFERLERLLVNNQDRARAIRLKNEWVTMDPRHWNSGMDARIEVGLGFDNKEQEAMLLQTLVMQEQDKLLQVQGGVDGMFFGPEEYINSRKKAAEVAGLKGVDSYWRDPKSPEAQQAVQRQQQAAQQNAQNNPEVIKAQVEMAKMQGEQQKMQLEAQKIPLEQAKVQTDQAKVALDRDKLAQEERIRVYDIDTRAQIEREKIASAERQTAAKLTVDTAKLTTETNANVVKMRSEDERAKASAELEREKVAASAGLEREKMAHSSALSDRVRESRAKESSDKKESKGEKTPPVTVIVEGSKGGGMRLVRDGEGNIMGSEPAE